MPIIEKVIQSGARQAIEPQTGPVIELRGGLVAQKLSVLIVI